MKQQKTNNVVTVLAFLLGLAFLMALLGWLYRPRDNSEEGGTFLTKSMGYLSEPEDSIDVFFLGSSEFYAGVCPLRIWDEAGITSYDMATPGQRIYHAEYYLPQILETHRTKLVVFDAFVAVAPGNGDDAVFYQWAKPFPILLNHNNWKLFGLKELLSPVRYTHHEVNKGFRPRGIAKGANYSRYMQKTGRRADVPWINTALLDSVCRQCKEAGVELLFLSVPSPVNWNYARHNTMQDYADRQGVPFLDLNLVADEVGIDPKTDFRDGGDHLNGPGAKKVSIYLAAYLREHYGLESHRDDPAYAQWQQDYITFTTH